MIAGVECKAHLGLMTLPYSDAYFLSAYPSECTESFHAAHQAAFDFYGAVPLRTSYDNTSIAVKKIVGRERLLTREFLRLQSHFLFDEHFCRVRRGNEKGHVETHVGYARRNLLVPVPSFASFGRAERVPGGRLLRRSVPASPRQARDQGRAPQSRHRRHVGLPTARFEVRRVEQAQVNSLSLVRFDRNDYSVPDRLRPSRRDVSRGDRRGPHLLRCRRGRHPSPFVGQRGRLLRLPPLPGPAWSESPARSTSPAPSRASCCPQCLLTLRRRLEADLGHGGTREFIKVLRLLEHSTMRELTGAVEEALSIGATGADAVTCILHHRSERPVGLFSLDGHPHLKSVTIEAPRPHRLSGPRPGRVLTFPQVDSRPHGPDHPFAGASRGN